jgi:hypothetical protein
MFRILAILAVAALAALLAGCAGPSTSDIAITDRSTFIPSGRVGIDISPHVENPSVPHTGHGLEVGFSGASGDDTQSLGSGARPVVFGGVTFNAPTQLNHEFDFRFAEIAYRYRRFFGAGEFGIEALGGLGYAEFDLTVSSPTARATDKLSNGGLLGGFGIVWKFRPTTSLQSRLTLFGSGRNEGVTAAARFDAYIAQALGRHAAVRAGVAGWSLTSEREGSDNFSSSNSQIRARFSGIALGLDLAF